MEADYTLRDEMLSLNYGVAVTTARSAPKTEFGNVKPVPITYPSFRRKPGLVWKAEQVYKGSIQLFFDFARDFYSHGRPEL